jgi:3-(3-hydroxy-phenyl)propionate hydroxylase
MSDFASRHPYGLALLQNADETILAGWVAELGVAGHRGRDVTGLAQDEDGVDVEASGGPALRAAYLVGGDGGRSPVPKGRESRSPRH